MWLRKLLSYFLSIIHLFTFLVCTSWPFCIQSAETYINAMIDNYWSRTFDNIQADLDEESKISSLISFLQNAKWGYFVQPNEFTEIVLDAPIKSSYNNQEELLLQVLNSPWPIPIPLYFTHQKLWQLLLLTQQKTDLTDPTDINKPIFDYLNNQDECTLLTILYNYEYANIETIIQSPSSLNDANNVSLLSTIKTYFIQKTLNKNLQKKYYTILRRYKLNEIVKKHFTHTYYEKIDNDLKENSITKIKLLLDKYSTISTSFFEQEIRKILDHAMQNFSSSVPKIKIENNHLDLSNLDLYNEKIGCCFTEDIKAELIENKIITKDTNTFIELFDFSKHNIKKTAHLFGYVGNQPYCNYFYLIFPDITILTLNKNPKIVNLNIAYYRAIFPNLIQINISKKNVNIICTNMNKRSKVELIGQIYNSTDMYTDIDNQPYTIRHPLILHCLDPDAQILLENLYKDCYKTLFLDSKYIDKILSKKPFNLAYLLTLYLTINYFTHGNLTNIYTTTTEKLLTLLLPTYYTFFLKHTINKEQTPHRITISRWVLSKIFFILLNFLYMQQLIILIRKDTNLIQNIDLLMSSLNIGMLIYVNVTFFKNPIFQLDRLLFTAAINIIKNRSYIPVKA